MHVSKNEIKYLRSLSQKKVREQEQKFVLEGWQPLQEALGSEFKIEFIGVTKSSVGDADRQSILSQAKKKSIPVRELSAKELEQISSTVHAQGVTALVHQKHYSVEDVLLKKSHIVVAADAVSDPGNLGSIIRSCDWFGVDALLLGRGCVELYSEKVVRSTAGSIFHLPIVEQVDFSLTLKEAKDAGYYVASFSGDGTHSYRNGQLQQQSIFVFGSEAHGVSKEVRKISDAVLKIPRYGLAESLNVGVACGIVLAHVRVEMEKNQ